MVVYASSWFASATTPDFLLAVMNKSKYAFIAIIPAFVYTAHIIGLAATVARPYVLVDQPKIKYFLIMADCFRIVTDVGIAGAMCGLSRRPSMPPSTNILLKSVVMKSLTTGVLTSIFIIASFITYLTLPHTVIFLAIYLMYSKIGANAMLASLNMRKAMRSQANALALLRLHALPAEGEQWCSLIFWDWSGLQQYIIWVAGCPNRTNPSPPRLSGCAVWRLQDYNLLVNFIFSLNLSTNDYWVRC